MKQVSWKTQNSDGAHAFLGLQGQTLIMCQNLRRQVVVEGHLFRRARKPPKRKSDCTQKNQLTPQAAKGEIASDGTIDLPGKKHTSHDMYFMYVSLRHTSQ